MKKKTKWKVIKNENIRHLWICAGCGDEKHFSPAAFYADHGNPVCRNCDGDMVYVRTESNA